MHVKMWKQKCWKVKHFKSQIDDILLVLISKGLNMDLFFWKRISKGLNMDLYLWERSYWVRTTTALSEREDISIEHGLLLVKRMTLEAERIYEQKFRLKFGHLESELTRWRVWHSFIHPFIYSFTMHSFVLNSFIHTYKTQRNFSFHDVRMFMMIT